MRHAVVDVVGPEVPAALIRLAIQKIQVVEFDEEPGCIDGVRAVSEIVVDNGYGGRCLGAQSAAQWIAEIDLKRLWSLQIGIIDDEDGDGLRGLTRSELDGGKPGFVIAARRGFAILDVAILCGGLIAGAEADGGCS